MLCTALLLDLSAEPLVFNLLSLIILIEPPQGHDFKQNYSTCVGERETTGTYWTRTCCCLRPYLNVYLFFVLFQPITDVYSAWNIIVVISRKLCRHFDSRSFYNKLHLNTKKSTLTLLYSFCLHPTLCKLTSHLKKNSTYM